MSSSHSFRLFGRRSSARKGGKAAPGPALGEAVCGQPGCGSTKVLPCAYQDRWQSKCGTYWCGKHVTFVGEVPCCPQHAPLMSAVVSVSSTRKPQGNHPTVPIPIQPEPGKGARSCGVEACANPDLFPCSFHDQDGRECGTWWCGDHVEYVGQNRFCHRHASLVGSLQGTCGTPGCGAREVWRCSYRDRHGRECGSTWCREHVRFVGTVPFCEEHGGLMGTLSVHHGSVREIKTLPTLDDRCASLAEFVSEEVHDQIIDLLQQRYHDRPDAQIMADERVRDMWYQTQLVWWRTWGALTNAGYLTRIAIWIPMVAPPVTPTVHVLVDSNIVFKQVPDWIIRDQRGEPPDANDLPNFTARIVESVYRAVDMPAPFLVASRPPGEPLTPAGAFRTPPPPPMPPEALPPPPPPEAWVPPAPPPPVQEAAAPELQPPAPVETAVPLSEAGPAADPAPPEPPSPDLRATQPFAPAPLAASPPIALDAVAAPPVSLPPSAPVVEIPPPAAAAPAPSSTGEVASIELAADAEEPAPTVRPWPKATAAQPPSEVLPEPSPDPLPAVAAGPAAVAPGVRRLMIIAEEAAAAASVLEVASQLSGVEVVAVSVDPIQALDEAARLSPELALVHLKLSSTAGLWLTERFNTEMPDVPVILLTEDGSSALLRRAHQAGARDVLLWPYALAQMEISVHRFLPPIEPQAESAAAPPAAEAPAWPESPAAVAEVDQDGQLSKPVLASEVAPAVDGHLAPEPPPGLGAAAAAPVPAAPEQPVTFGPLPVVNPTPSPAPVAPPAAAPVSTPAGAGDITVVFSGKGGVGKSLIATNLAAAIAGASGSEVGLIDLDLQFGDLGVLLNIRPATSISDVVDGYPELDSGYLASLMPSGAGGIRLLAAPASPELADLVKPEHVKALLAGLRGTFRHVVVDLGAHLDDRALEAVAAADQIILITDLDLSTIKNARLALNLFDKLSIPSHRVFVVLNRSDAITTITPDQVEQHLKHPVSAQIPTESGFVQESVHVATPLVNLHPEADLSQALRALVAQIGYSTRA